MWSRGKNRSPKRIPRVIYASTLIFSTSVLGKLEDVEKELQKSQANFVERFTQFTQDKNFLGKPRTPDGKTVQGRTKTVFNPDDKGPFQSDLTYHDKSYETEDEAFAKKAEEEVKQGKSKDSVKRRYIYAGISDHGAVSAGGGSSQLERVAYSLFDQYAKLESEKEKKQEDEKKGITYRGVFKVETQEVKKKEGQGGNPEDNDTEPEKVERWSIREEANPKIEEVGKNSFLTLEKSAINDKVDQPGAMPNLAYYYEAANQALTTLWNSTLANLGQRRAYKAIDPKIGANNVELSLATPSCDAWAQQAIAKVQQEEQDPGRKERKVQDIGRMVQQCKQVGQVSFRQINPRFEVPDDPNASSGGGPANNDPQEQLVMKGPEEEDARERDWRVKLNTLSKVSTKASDVQSNWKYNDQDDRAQVTTQYDQNGQAVQTESLTMNDQVQRYNNNLQEASQALADVKGKLPANIRVDAKAPLQFKKTGEESAMEITKFPSQAAYEGFETPVAPQQAKPAESYDQLTSGKVAE